MKIALVALLLCLTRSGFCQTQEVERLKRQLASAKQDTSRVLLMARLCELSTDSNLDSALAYGQQALALAQRIQFPYGEVVAAIRLGRTIRVQGDNPKALELLTRTLAKAEQIQATHEIALCLFRMGAAYLDMKEYAKGITYDRKASVLFKSIGSRREELQSLLNIAVGYRLNNQLDSALIVMQNIFPQMLAMGNADNIGFLFLEWGNLQFALGNYQEAFIYEKKPIPIFQKINNLRRLATIYNGLAQFYDQLNQSDSAIHYAQKGLAAATRLGFKREILSASQRLAKLFEPKDPAKALHYLKIAIATNEALFGAAKVQSLQKIVLEEQERQRQQEAYQTRMERLTLSASLGVFLLIALILYRSNRQQQKANVVLQKTLSDLRTTQTQLIQREKMASLGELTAGIAHEIQNPLNFVNNFSEVSVELIEEQKEALVNGNTREALTLADDLRENLKRITQNGQRASNIVKGMLEHSRTSTGERTPTDLNALCEEYLRLAYQGVRAKDSAFSCQFETDFEADLPLVGVVASDISRVLLNLFNNAFYAVNQKAKSVGQLASADYQPTVTLGTTQVNGQIEIRVRDNGTGIPEVIKEKVFQPFFTTKPTGEGTGLGLSLSYDIVTKGHGGMLTVESREGEGTMFIVKLPIQTS